ncbi:cation transporter, partial [Rhodopseudomonas sp. BR0C11]|uniref:cation diffusion facilitator family transporter n=1 Tax=Rhodopseudomonas sp. BR0C11 TaxID=2269370 RepID=UPI0013DFA363
MSHDHHHHHGPGAAHGAGGHSHAPQDFGRAFAIGITLNLVFVVAEAAFGYFSNSMALIADAGHNLSDVAGLVVAWIAAGLAKRPPSARYTYGLRGSSILAALFNAVFLLLAVGAIGWEAVVRLFTPEPVAGITVMVVAGIGIVINAVTAWLFASGRHSDLNIRGAYLHMAADAAVSAAVLVAGVIILFTGWYWIDPAVSLLVAVVIVWGTWGLLRDSTALSLAAVPRGIDPAAVRAFLSKLPGVTQVHDLHIWGMSTTEVALTCHLVMPGGSPGDPFLVDLAHE